MGTPWGEFIPRADLYLPQKGMDISMKKWKIAGLFAMALMMSVTLLESDRNSHPKTSRINQSESDRNSQS